MITRREILDAATRQSLGPQIIEKDIVLGWVLAGIDWHAELRETWVFKGGTCLKKCYFETYRFSEDLDFTLLDPAHLDEAFLRRVFDEIGAWIYQQSGIEMPAAQQRFEMFDNPRGNPSCQGRLGYRGPVSPASNSGGWPRLKLDLTADERVVLPPVRTPVFHPYSDAPDDGISVLAYDYIEAFAEKIRALAERTRPRDLYDVVNLFRHLDARPSPDVLRDVLGQKCEFKGIGLPQLEALAEFEEQLRAGWGHMLEHQLPALPSVDGFWGELPAFFEWLAGETVPVEVSQFAVGAGDEILRARRLDLPVGLGVQSYLETIRFAAGNRLIVELDYDGGTRRIEAYSLRRTRAGDIILAAHNVDRDQPRSYRVDRIQGARVTNTSFVPRWEIELTPEGPMSAPMIRRTSSASFGVSAATRRVVPGRPRTGAGRAFVRGPTHVFRCPVCGKSFRKKSMDPSLGKHKGRNGYDCFGSSGIYMRTDY